MASIITFRPLPEPSDVADGRGWLVILGDSSEHRVKLGRNSALWGPPRSFECDGAQHRLATFLGFLRRRSTNSFVVAGRPATISVEMEFTATARGNLRRNIGNPKVWLAEAWGGGAGAGTMHQRDRQVIYELTVDDTDGGSWVARLPDNVLSSWRFVPPGSGRP